MLRNGLLHRMLTEQPSLQYLLLHNIDTLGASIDPLVLTKHIESDACLSFEVISRRVEDRGGGLALSMGNGGWSKGWRCLRIATSLNYLSILP